MFRIPVILMLLLAMLGCTHRIEVAGLQHSDGTPLTAEEQKQLASHPEEATSTRMYVLGALLFAAGLAMVLATPLKAIGAFLATFGGIIIGLNAFLNWIQPFLPWLFGLGTIAGLLFIIYEVRQRFLGKVELIQQGSINVNTLSDKARKYFDEATAWLAKKK